MPMVLRRLLLAGLFLAAGCSTAAYGGIDDRGVSHGSFTDTGPAARDAAAPPVDAARTDAYRDPATCPTYTTDVAPMYVRHCASCHTTGRDAHFGSSYAVATQGTSSCRTPMASCTITLGRPGGSMARRDRLGGFSVAEQQTIQAWIDCGMPM